MSDNWQPIETAPKDRPALIYWPRYYCPSYGHKGDESHMAIGWWKKNHNLAAAYSLCAEEKEKKGLMTAYFSDTYELDDYGLAHPDYQPSHWRPLPEPPV